MLQTQRFRSATVPRCSICEHFPEETKYAFINAYKMIASCLLQKCISSLSRYFSLRDLKKIPTKRRHLYGYIGTLMILSSFFSLSLYRWENTLTYKNFSSAAFRTTHENCRTYEDESWQVIITTIFSLTWNIFKTQFYNCFRYKVAWNKVKWQLDATMYLLKFP